MTDVCWVIKSTTLENKKNSAPNKKGISAILRMIFSHVRQRYAAYEIHSPYVFVNSIPLLFVIGGYWMKTLVIWLPTSWEDKMKACIDVSPKTLPAVSRLNPTWTSSLGPRSRNSSTRLSPSTTLKALSFVRPLVTLCPTSFGGNGQESKWIMYQKYRYVFRLLWWIGLRYVDMLARTS